MTVYYYSIPLFEKLTVIHVVQPFIYLTRNKCKMLTEATEREQQKYKGWNNLVTRQSVKQ